MQSTLAVGNDANAIPSSSPAFGTPAHPIRPIVPATITATNSSKPVVLPVLIPATSLRPIAFRTFTKKHSLTLTSSALQALATFVGKNCGAKWREEGLAEKVLEEVARSWKKSRGSGIVDGADQELVDILRGIELSMVGGKIVAATSGRRTAPTLVREDSVNAGQMETLSVSTPQSMDVQQETEDICQDPRKFLKVVSLFDQPRLFYDPNRRHFEKVSKSPSLLPDPSQKTKIFRDRYHLVQQRILRNESFQAPTIKRGAAAVNGHASLSRTESSFTQQNAYTLTPIANLLGRSGSNHVLLGLLTTLPTGQLAISDLTGSIVLDLSNAVPVPKGGSWFVPGMIVIVEGSYHEEDSMDGLRLGGGGGVGGTIGGKFAAASIGGPPSERREVSLGITDHKKNDQSTGGGFGWVDFFGVGSEKSFGSKMRTTESHVWRVGSADSKRSKMVCIGELNLDNEQTLGALKRILSLYAAAPVEDMPMAFILVGNFVTNATMAGGRAGGSIEYKECFDLLASILSDYPTLLQAATFVFVPGDNDPWPSAFSSGATTAIPRRPIPELFTSRIKRAFATANTDTDRVPCTELNGEAVWASNPTRLSLFGPVNEMVIFRDDMSSRLRRNSIALTAEDESDEIGEGEMDMEHLQEKDLTSQTLTASRKLVKTILDQGHLCPFPMSIRPILWDWASSLNLYPLPTAMLLIDPEAPAFAVTYEGCQVMNPGRLLAEGRRGIARWMEYDARTKKGLVREELMH
ncbi:MAG: hypothetical protein GOMPHAMPRED_008277 [Gomphillus americanus]|uniref:DNA polymerase epsilon subunit B n=1 Tax=Gomphillus americanus TaxID=1940652 RepID=A0A8H3IDT5_9LECA|nr:MAG: hypothetical protein GOMPHAMPRED_008277 [Gomphillus americanus]